MHHAYLQYGSLSDLVVITADARKRFGFTAEHNPDVQVREYEKFGIDEARTLSSAAALRSSSGRALFIIGVGAITTEAQQALLKLFEEPQEGSIFVLLAPHGAIIPTLRSRFLDYPESPKEIASQKVLGSPRFARPDHFGKQFLSATQKVRSAEITKLLKDDEGARERVRDFLNALEVELHASLIKTKGAKEIIEGLEDIAKVRSYVGDRSPSLKMLLEHLALSLPKI
jgi:hypothetical protein